MLSKTTKYYDFQQYVGNKSSDFVKALRNKERPFH